MLIVPATLTRQYDNTPDGGVCTLLEEERVIRGACLISLLPSLFLLRGYYFVFGVQHATMEGVFPCSFSLLKRLSHSILKIPSLIPFCRTLLYKIASTDVNDSFKISVFYTDQNHISQGILFNPNFSCYDISWHKLESLKVRLSSR